MGSTNWSDDDYKARTVHRAATNTSTFAHHDTVAAAPRGQKKAHPTLDPLNIKGGCREARDSAAHPESHAVAVLLDQTGSMQNCPRTVQQNLPKLMGLLQRKAFLPHPAILIGAIGDANSDEVPLQVGQFESGIEIENDLTNLYLEGNGGGQERESYELAAYFMARHTKMDCFEKRNRKGYLFIIGDEALYPDVKRVQIERIIGDKVESDIPTPALFEELKQQWEIFYVMPKLTQHYGDANILRPWRQLLGQNVLMLDDAEGICELIASTIGLAEGTADIASVNDAMADAGTSKGVADAVGKALIPFAASRGRDLAVASSGGPSGLTKI